MGGVMNPKAWKLIAAAFVATVGAAVAGSPSLTNVPSANPKAAGYAPSHQLSPELRQKPVAVGAMTAENPQGIIGWDRYENDAPSPANMLLPQMGPASLPPPPEAQKPEPRKHTTPPHTAP